MTVILHSHVSLSAKQTGLNVRVLCTSVASPVRAEIVTLVSLVSVTLPHNEVTSTVTLLLILLV